MREDKKMIINDAKNCIKDSSSFIVIASNSMDSEKSLDFRNALREFGENVVCRSFPKKLLFKVCKSVADVEIEDFSKKDVSLATASNGVDIASVIKKACEKNASYNKGLRPEQKREFIKVMAGVVEGKFYNVQDAHLLEKLITLGEARGNIMSMIVNPMSSLMGMIKEKSQTS